MPAIQSAVPQLALQATTGPAGFALTAGTPAILTWNVPNDGRLHRIITFGDINVSSGTTGGVINIHVTDPGGTAGTLALDAGTHGGTGFFMSTVRTLFVNPGSVVTVSQDSGLSGGAAVYYAELWGS